MSGLNWDKAKRDRERSKERAQQPRRVSQDRKKPATRKQLQYLRGLAGALGIPVPKVKSAFQAYIAIDRLKQMLDARKAGG